MTYRLHAFAQSGNCYKVALYLACAGLPFEIVPVAYGAGQTREPGWREVVNPMGEAPVLEVDGERMTQSGAILTWLAEHTGHFEPQGEKVRYEALRWILFDNHKFTSFNATHRFLRTFKTPAEPDPAVMAFLKARQEAAFDVVEKHMAGRPFVAHDQPTIADFSMMGYLFFPPQEVGFELAQDYPAIHAWTQRIRALPGWKAPYDLLPSADMPRRAVA
jgi:glutathione S-transferase